MSKLDIGLRSVPQACLCGLIRGYQRLVSPILSALFGPTGLGCRYTPTCSAYMHEAVTTHGVLKGSAFGLSRLCRCHPWGGAGHDPVPPANSVACSETPLNS